MCVCVYVHKCAYVYRRQSFQLESYIFGCANYTIDKAKREKKVITAAAAAAAQTTLWAFERHEKITTTTLQTI